MHKVTRTQNNMEARNGTCKAIVLSVQAYGGFHVSIGEGTPWGLDKDQITEVLGRKKYRAQESLTFSGMRVALQQKWKAHTLNLKPNLKNKWSDKILRASLVKSGVWLRFNH